MATPTVITVSTGTGHAQPGWVGFSRRVRTQSVHSQGLASHMSAKGKNTSPHPISAKAHCSPFIVTAEYSAEDGSCLSAGSTSESRYSAIET